MSLLSEALTAHAADGQRLHDFTFPAVTLHFHRAGLPTAAGFARRVPVPARQIRRVMKLHFLLDFRFFFVQHVLCRRLDGAAVQRLRDSAQVGRVLLV